MKRCLLIVLLFFSVSAKAQTYFNKLYDYDNVWQGVSSAIAFYDSSYFVVGWTNDLNDPNNYTKLFLIKLNQHGDTIATKVYAEDSISITPSQESLYYLDDGTFVFSATVKDYTQNEKSDYALYKFDENFNLIWSKRYGGLTTNEYCLKMKQCHDGGFILSGQSAAVDPYADIFLVRTDSEGNFLWQKNIPIYAWQRPYGLDITSDSGFVVGFNSGGGIDVDVIVLKTDSLGNVKWQRTVIGGTLDNSSWVKISTAQNGDILVATSKATIYARLYDAYLARLSPTGTKLWEKTYPYEYTSGFLTVPNELDDENIVIGGIKRIYNSTIGTTRIQSTLSKFDKNGDPIWERLYYKRDDLDQYFYGISKTADDGFLAFGFAWEDTQDAWVIKTDYLGCDTTGCTPPPLSVGQSQYTNIISVYPNPATNYLKVDLKDILVKDLNISLLDIFGKKIKHEIVKQNEKKIELQLTDLSSGMYFLVISGNNTILLNEKIIINK